MFGKTKVIDISGLLRDEDRDKGFEALAYSLTINALEGMSLEYLQEAKASFERHRNECPVDSPEGALFDKGFLEALEVAIAKATSPVAAIIAKPDTAEKQREESPVTAKIRRIDALTFFVKELKAKQGVCETCREVHGTMATHMAESVGLEYYTAKGLGYVDEVITKLPVLMEGAATKH